MADLFKTSEKVDFKNYEKEKKNNYTPTYKQNIENVEAQQAERLENRKRYGVQVSDEDYARFNQNIANAEDKDAESHKIGSALRIAQETGLEPNEVYLNYDNIVNELYGDRYKANFSGAHQAICDSFEIGRNNIRIGTLGNLIADAYKKGDTESIEVYRKEYEQLKKLNESLSDNAPRTWGTEAVKCFAQSAPFMGTVGAAALFGNFLIPGLGGFAGTTLTTAQLTQGEEILSMLDEGIEFDTAYKVAGTSALLQGLTEAALDGVTAGLGNVAASAVNKSIAKSGKQKLLESITNSLQKKFHFGAGKKIALQVAMDYASSIPNEMLEEGVQSLISDVSFNEAAIEHNKKAEEKLNNLLDTIGNDLYEELKERELVEENSLGKIVDNAKQSMKAAFMATLVSGAATAGLNTAASFIDYKRAYQNAEKIPSFEAYKKVEADNPVFEKIEKNDKEKAMREVWENAQSTRDKRDAEIIAGTKETTAFNENMEEAPAENDEGETEVIPAARDENGRLYTENELKETEEGEKQKGVFKIGNAEASDKNLYGYINYTLDDEGENKTVTINDFKMTAYRRGLTQEAYDEFAQTMAEEYPDYKIEWNPTSRAGKELKELLISKNLSGKNNGLNYYTTERLADIETRKEVSKQIAQYMPNLNGDQRAAAVALLEAGARRQGYSLTDYVQNTFGGKIFGELSELDSKNVTAAQRQEMKGAQGWRRYGNQIKAVIYAGEKADFSTFAHEIAHVWQSQLTGDLKEQAEKAFNVKNGDWDKSTFTFADGHTESSGEAFARGFEQFLETGKAPNAEMKTLFQKFAEFLQDVYKTLKQFINMSPEIESVYNQLMDADDSVLKLAEKAVNQADRELFAKLQEEKRVKAEAEKAAAEEQKQAEEQEKQDTKDEESEITLDDEAIAEPDFSPIEETEESEEEAEPETDNEAAQESGSASDENGEIPEDMFFQKVTENLKNNGVENAEEVTKVIQDKAATITEKVRKSSDAAREALRFQIIGEKGAAALDKAEEATTRLDNLKIAREMTEAGKDAKTIRLATGWEKGTDGLWRYEIDDSKVDFDSFAMIEFNKENPRLDELTQKLINGENLTKEEQEEYNSLNNEYSKVYDLKNHSTEAQLFGKHFRLYEILDNEALYKAYPKLNNIVVSFQPKNASDVNGAYSYADNSITLYVNQNDEWKEHENLKSTLLHEVQHIIQRYEGFAEGGSPQDFAPLMSVDELQQYKNVLLNNVEYNNNKAQEILDKINKDIDADTKLAEFLPKIKSREKNLDDWFAYLTAEQEKHPDYKEYKFAKERAQQSQNEAEELGKYRTKSGELITPEQAYLRLAGEVESRNVQARRNFTPEERLNTLLSETADVAPEDQIVLRDGLGISESNDIEQTEKIEQAETERQIETIRKMYQGTDKWLKAPNGESSNLNEKQWLQVRTPSFKNWFGDWENAQENASKVLDENGEPLVVYHGTDAEFNIFEGSNNYHFGTKAQADLRINDYKEYLKNEIKELREKADKAESQTDKFNLYNASLRAAERLQGFENPKIMGVFLNIRNLKETEDENAWQEKTEKYRAQGYDGFKYYNVYENDGNYSYAVFNPNQIKSSADNNGNFDPNISDIRFQKVYHGSGADFDKFNTEQYGLSGEGSMSFGYGTYVTDSEEIARDYAARNSNIPGDYTTENIDKIKKEIKSFESIIADYKTKLEDKNISDRLRYVTEKDLKKIENKLEKKKTSLNVAEEVIKNATKKRNLYTVEIPDDGYLGWFETVSKSNRSKIAEALFNKIIELDEEGMYKGAEKELKAELNSAFESDTDGSHIYGTLIDYLGSDKEASRFLHSIGFAGIKYPAGTNYGNGNGAFNYVIFDDEQAKIIDHLRFQTEEELYNDARSFDNWQEFMEYEQGTGDWLDDVSPIPSDADAAWYKTTWELAHGIDKANEIQEEPESDSQSEQIKDAIFLVEMEKPGVLEHFLQEVDYINKFDFDEAGAPQDADEAAEFAKIQRLKDYIHTKLSHGSWISNATRVAGGKELTPATRKRLMTLITYATREYRDIYTEITGNQRFAVNPEESYFNEKVLPYAKKLNKLLTPEEALTMSPEQLRQLADSLSDEVSNKEIAAKIKNGTLKMDDELKNYITKLDRRVKLAEERYSKLEKETEADYRKITDYAQRRLLDTYDELLKARANLNNKKNLLDKKIANGIKLTEKYKREVQTAQLTYDDIFKAWSNLTAVNKISAEVQEAMKRKEEYIATIEEQAKLKNDKAILTQISDMRKKLVKNAMRRVPFERINYEHAKKIIAIQRIFYPNLKGDVNKWIGEKPIYIKGIVAEYLTNAEKKEEIDKMLNRKANRAGETGTRNRIEYLQDLLRKTKSSDEVDKWTTRDKNLLMRYIPQSDWVKDLNLEALEKERAESIQLDIDEEGYTETKTVKNAKGKEQVLIIHRPKFSEEIGRMVKDELGAELYNILINKPFEDWTTAEMEKFTIRINDIYTEGRDELEAKRQAQRDEAKEIRDAIRNAVRDTGIEFKDTDTPEERKEKQKKLDKILGTSTVKGTLSSKKEKQRSKLGKILHGYYDANVRRVARILDGYNDGINVNELYFKEAECYDAKERMLRTRNEKIGAVLKDNNIKLEDLYQTMEIDGTVYSYDELLYILAADKDYDLKDEDAGIIKAMETDPYANNDDYAPTARNAVMFGNLGSADTDLDMKEGLADEDRETKERIANNEFTEEEKKAIEEGFELVTTPGTKKYIAACHQRYARVIQAAKAMLAENPQFEKLMDAIDADYTEQFERLQKISIEEFNAPVNRVKKYVPLNRMESNGDTNENRVREDLLATSGAGTGRQYVDKGMTQKRINISPLNQKPVELGLYKTWADATERTEHFINYAGYVRELNRVYKSRESTYLRRFIENRYGKDAVNYIDDYIAEVANPNANSATGALDTIVRTLRGKTAPAYLSWKASSIIKQAATSPMPYMQFVTPVEYLKASFDIIGSKGRMYDDIKEKSIFMNNRVMDPLIDLIEEQSKNATNPVTSKLNKFSNLGMQGLEWIDWACVAPGWLACYRKKYAELEKANDIELIEAQIREENEILDPSNPDRMTNDQIKAAAEERAKSEEEIENEAVQWADDCTRLCQPSNRKVDLAPLFKESGKGSEIGKAFLQFQTSLNVIWQNLRYDIPYAIRRKQFKQVAGMILGYTIAGILVNAITEGIKPKDDDEDKELSVLRKLLYYSTTQFTDAIPVIGSIVSNLNNKIITGDKGFTSSSNDLIPMFTKAATGTQSAIKGNWEKALKNYLEAAGLATGLPVSGTKEALRFFGIGDGEEGAEFKPGSLLGRRE